MLLLLLLLLLWWLSLLPLLLFVVGVVCRWCLLLLPCLLCSSVFPFYPPPSSSSSSSSSFCAVTSHIFGRFPHFFPPFLLPSQQHQHQPRKSKSRDLCSTNQCVKHALLKASRQSTMKACNKTLQSLIIIIFFDNIHAHTHTHA